MSNHVTYSPLAASLAANFVYQIATLMHIDDTSNTLSDEQLNNTKKIDNGIQ